ncbi:MAG: XRE family transcriptional regulator [Methylococcaceae bacterium]|nr:MAG: XRE family transcriptional regulator [Methylococcaceae bacterium]
MKVHEKIRFMRQLKGLSQENVADKLALSVNGYADIERGKTDVQVSRLEQIAEAFDMDLIELLSFGEKNVACQIGNNNHNNWQNTYAKESDFELQKLQLIVEQQGKEIAYLKEIIDLMKKAAESTAD